MENNQKIPSDADFIKIIDIAVNVAKLNLANERVRAIMFPDDDAVYTETKVFTRKRNQRHSSKK